jgi:branched-chain amino acid transport system substrate-binding protein
MSIKQINAARRSILGAAAAIAGLWSTPAPLRAAQPIKIGFLGPLSGALAFVGQTNRNCLALAASEINAAGGVAGRPIEIVTEDSQMSSKTALDRARKLFTSDGVDAVTGMVLALEREAAISVAVAANKMVIHPNFDEGRCHPNLITTGLAVNQVAPAIAWMCRNIGKTLYVLASDLGTVRDILVPQIKAAMEREGGQLVGAQFFPFGTRDFGPALQQVKAANPAIVWHGIGDDPITFVKQYKSFGMKPQLATQVMHESIAAATDGDSVGALSVESYFMSIDTAANQKFLDAYTERFRSFVAGRFVRGRAVVLPHGERTYAALKVWAEAVGKAGSTDAAKVRDALSRVEVALPRGTVRVAASGHLLCETLIGRVLKDNAIEVVARAGVVTPQCSGTK